MRNYSSKISQRMFDFASFYDEVADWLPDVSTIAEIGLGDGASSIYLAEALLNRGKIFTLHMVDSLAYGGPDQLNTIIGHVVKAGLFGVVQIMPYDSLNASVRFPDGHFDFVFVDASHRLEPTKADIRLWSHKMKATGILAGHDYNTEEGAEVRLAVDQVVPIDQTRFVPTEKNCGIWWIKTELNGFTNAPA